MKLLQKRIKDGTMEVNEDDPFELFICATEIRWTYYKDTQKILGKTYDMLVLQDFEAITPNLLARKGPNNLFEISLIHREKPEFSPFCYESKQDDFTFSILTQDS